MCFLEDIYCYKLYLEKININILGDTFRQETSHAAMRPEKTIPFINRLQQPLPSSHFINYLHQPLLLLSPSSLYTLLLHQPHHQPNHQPFPSTFLSVRHIYGGIHAATNFFLYLKYMYSSYEPSQPNDIC